MNVWALISVCAYFLLFLATAIGIFLWKVKRRGGRAPVAFKLLRGPGETIRRRMAKFDEDFIFRMGAASFVPLCAALAALSPVVFLHPKT